MTTTPDHEPTRNTPPGPALAAASAGGSTGSSGSGSPGRVVVSLVEGTVVDGVVVLLEVVVDVVVEGGADVVVGVDGSSSSWVGSGSSGA